MVHWLIASHIINPSNEDITFAREIEEIWKILCGLKY